MQSYERFLTKTLKKMEIIKMQIDRSRPFVDQFSW